MDSLTVTSSMLPQYLESIHVTTKAEGADHSHQVALHNMEPAIGSFVPWTTDGSVPINSSDPFVLKSDPESQTGDVAVSGPLAGGPVRHETEAMFSSGQRFTDLEYCQSMGNVAELAPNSVGVTTPTQPTPSLTYVPAVAATVALTSKGQPRADLPLPPKKPLSPYMRFSKGIWQQVKTANPGMSVCEVGATIGRIWRELDDVRKQQFIEEFNSDKVRYDTELQGYLRTNGLQASDLIKPRAKKTAKDPSPSKKSKSQQAKPPAPPAATPDLQPTAAVNVSSVAQPAPSIYHTPDEASMVLPSFGQVWSNADTASHRDLLAQVVYDSHLHDEREGNAETENPNPIFSQAQMALTSGTTPICSDQNAARSDQNVAPMPITTTNNWWWTTESHPTLAQPGRAIFTQVGNADANKAGVVAKTEASGSGDTAPGGNGAATTMVDAEKLFLRGALVEKTQEVVQLMRELEQAYGLIHRLKQQNDFFFKWYQDQRSGTAND